MSRLQSQSHPQPALANDQKSLGREIGISVLGIAAALATGWALDLETTYGFALGMATFAVLRIAYLFRPRKQA